MHIPGTLWLTAVFYSQDADSQVSNSFDSLQFTGRRDWDRKLDRLSRQAILDEKIKKFLAVRIDNIYNVDVG